MKTLLRKGTLLAAALLLLLLFPAPLHAQYVLDLSSIDYFTTSGDIPVSPAGGQAQVEFGFYSGGPAASVLRSTVLQAVEDADCGHIITNNHLLSVKVTDERIFIKGKDFEIWRPCGEDKDWFRKKDL